MSMFGVICLPDEGTKRHGERQQLVLRQNPEGHALSAW